MEIEVSRRERKKDETRERIFREAIRLFRERGFEKTTIDDTKIIRPRPRLIIRSPRSRRRRTTAFTRFPWQSSLILPNCGHEPFGRRSFARE